MPPRGAAPPEEGAQCALHPAQAEAKPSPPWGGTNPPHPPPCLIPSENSANQGPAHDRMFRGCEGNSGSFSIFLNLPIKQNNKGQTSVSSISSEAR